MAEQEGGGSQRGVDSPSPGDDGPGRRGGIVAGDGSAFVSHTSEVYPSGFLPGSAGTVPEESIVDVYRNSGLFERLRDRSELRSKCGPCEFKHVRGGSRSRAYATTGDPFAADPLCGYVPEGSDGPMSGSELSTPAK